MILEHIQIMCRLGPCITAYPSKDFKASQTDMGPVLGVDCITACIMNISGPEISHSQATCH